MIVQVSASLCDGEDERSEELAAALAHHCTPEEEHKKCLKVRAAVENLVHTLLRLREFTNRLPQMFEPSEKAEVNETDDNMEVTDAEYQAIQMLEIASEVEENETNENSESSYL